jgi:hypothetical protein
VIQHTFTYLWALTGLMLITLGCTAPVPTEASTETLEVSISPIPIATGEDYIPLVPNQTEVAYVPPFAYKTIVPAVDIDSNEANPEHKVEIAKSLAIRWLDYYTGENLPNRVRLQEYSIISVTVPNEWQLCLLDAEKEFRAEIHFRVKLSEIYYNPWCSGGGTVSEDFLWVTRTHHPLIVQEGDNYVMVFDGFNHCHTPVP